MGCSKNIIDSERLIKRLENKGYQVFHNAEMPECEYVVVNTCGFIGDAKEESVNLILSLTDLKKKRTIGNVVVMGCLSERYKNELPQEIPEVDIWFGKFDWNAFVESLPSLNSDSRINLEKIWHSDKINEWERSLTTPPWSAYLKVSEGCDRYCAYCAIPLITGRHKSRPIEEILEEVEHLVHRGVKEFNVIAQDLSSYGLDLYNLHKLPELIDRMAHIENVEWIRLHYLYPTDFPIELLDVINRNDNVCKYLDIAFQHISDKVLIGMNRKTSKKETLNLISAIREKVPGIHIRTTVMTGFPGEDEEAFEELKEFIRSQRFDRLGGFAYCEEEDTLAAKTFKDSIPYETKKRRLDEIMAIQEDISLELNLKKVGSVVKVLVEENDGNTVIGRSEFDSPEVDQEIYIDNCKAQPGSFIQVKITEAGPFELRGIEQR